MISKEDLNEYKTYKDQYQVEKDYLQDLILYNIYSITSNELVLKGGTAFSKFYYSDRFSEDLDFVLQIQENALNYAKVKIEEAFKKLEYRYSYREEPKENKHKNVKAIALIEGPRYNHKQSTLQQVQIEISTKHKTLLEPKAMPRNPVYADARSYVALVMQPDEIIAEKLRALTSKGRKHKERDLYDIYHFIGKGAVIRKELVDEKFAEVEKKLVLDNVLEYIETIKSTWSSLKPFVQHTLQSFDDVSSNVIDNLEKALK